MIYLIAKRTDDLPQDLVQSRDLDLDIPNRSETSERYGHFLTPDLAASKHHAILR